MAGTRSGSGGARGDLTHADLDRLRPHVINLRFGQFSTEGTFRTTQADVERIFREELPAAIAAAPKPFRLLFWAHGGLVSESNGLRVAMNLFPQGFQIESIRRWDE